MVDTPPKVRSLADCGACDGQRVRVIGTYEPIPIGHPTPYEDPPQEGHVRIRLEEGDGPLLERYWHEDGVRPEDERTRFDGREVAVVARFAGETPPRPGDPPWASHPVFACLLEIEKIELI